MKDRYGFANLIEGEIYRVTCGGITKEFMIDDMSVKELQPDGTWKEIEWEYYGTNSIDDWRGE